MIRAQKEGPGLNEGGGWKPSTAGEPGFEPTDTRPTLADVGIDKKLSSRSQAIASIPEADHGPKPPPRR